MSEGKTGFEGWAILELIGHRHLAGRVSEATVAGAAFIRIDVPHPNDSTLFRATHFYSPTAVRAITPTSMETACAIARGWAAGIGSRRPEVGGDGDAAGDDYPWSAATARKGAR